MTSDGALRYDRSVDFAFRVGSIRAAFQVPMPRMRYRHLGFSGKGGLTVTALGRRSKAELIVQKKQTSYALRSVLGRLRSLSAYMRYGLHIGRMFKGVRIGKVYVVQTAAEAVIERLYSDDH